jgi:hypothetical protein
MKYFLITFFLISTLTIDQQVEVLKMEKVTIPGNQKFFHPQFDHSGNKLLLTAENYKGLNLLELTENKLLKISDADGAGYLPQFSWNDETVLFQEQEFIEKRRFTKLQAWNKSTGETKLIEPAARNLSVPMIAGNRVMFRSDEELKSAVIDEKKPDHSDEIFAGIENQQLVLYRSEKRLVIKPYESESYIWPSISPDRKHVLAYAMGKGAFISDLTGMVLAELGQIEAPVWAGNDFIVGMVTKDDGHQILESSIVAVHPLSGKRQVLTPNDVIAMHPDVSAKKQIIVFHTPDGEIWFIQYQLNR